MIEIKYDSEDTRIDIDFDSTICFKNRILTKSKEEPKFKLDTYCINLEGRERNMEFIHNEWDEFCNITRFIALPTATKSHIAILKDIFSQKDKLSFPLVIMEDDVFRKNDFNKYWNQLKDFTDVDYIPLDAVYMVLEDGISPDYIDDFLRIRGHSHTGFSVYYKRFFDRFETVQHLTDYLGTTDVIDVKFTYDKNIIKYVSKKQVCRQITSKFSTTAHKIEPAHTSDSCYLNAEIFLNNRCVSK
jgi:hypothetical protein